MRHWAWAVRARLTSRSDLILFERMSANVRANRRSSAAAWPARTTARTAAARGSLSIGSGMDAPVAGQIIYSPIPITIGILYRPYKPLVLQQLPLGFRAMLPTAPHTGARVSPVAAVTAAGGRLGGSRDPAHHPLPRQQLWRPPRSRRGQSKGIAHFRRR